MTLFGAPPLRRPCANCNTEIAPALLACPACHALVHAQRLNELAARAEAAAAAHQTADAIAAWEEALTLLPEHSKQQAAVREKLGPLLRSEAARTDRPAAPVSRSTATGKWAGAALAGGALLWKFKFIVAFIATKGKLLLLGLTKGSTVFSMLASVGVYWAAFGLWFAVGLIGSIYVHEMGHVAALRRYGIPATAPMFIPGLGAFIRVQQMPASVAEQARIGLGGPLWGLFAALGATGAYVTTGNPLWAAIAHTGAWLNIFNLTPVWQLDGSRGFVALSRVQRWVLIAAIACAWLLTREGLLVLVLLVAAVRVFAETPPERPDRAVLNLYVLLIAVLALVSAWVPNLRP